MPALANVPRPLARRQKRLLRVPSPRYIKVIIRNTVRSTYRSVKRLVLLLNWLYIFGSLLSYYSLRLFWNNIGICYVILALFSVTAVIFLYSNFKKLNQQNNLSVNYSSFSENHKVKLSKFAFVDPMNWQSELNLLNKKSPDYDRLIYPDSMLISSILDQIVNLIVSSFIKPWYDSINQNKHEQDDLFIDEVKISIKSAVTNIYLKLSVLDFSNLVVLRLVPVISEHFNNFVSAKLAIKKKFLLRGSKNNKGSKANTKGNSKSSIFDDKLLNLTDEKQINLLISKFYKHGKLHPTVDSFRDNAQFSSFSQKAHLRTKLNKILPLLLNRNEAACLPVGLLIREIIINCVFMPVVNMVVDPDFWNRAIVDKIGSTLKDRTKVIQLRAELQKHSKNASKGKKSLEKSDKGYTNKNENGNTASNAGKNSDSSKKKSKSLEHNSLFEFKLTLNTSQSSFEKFLKKINKNTSIVDLRQLKFYINLQLQKTLRSDDYKTVVKKATRETAHKSNKFNDDTIITNKQDLKKVQDLYERYKILIKRLQIVQLTLTNRVNNINFETQANTLDNVSVNSSQTSFSKNKSSNNINVIDDAEHQDSGLSKVNLSLLTILNDSSLLTYYMEYMDQNNKILLLQFWLVVNGIKNPLEDSLVINADDIYTEDGATMAQISNSNSLSKDIDAKLNYNFNFANDIKLIFTNYFNNKLIIENNKVVYENVEKFVEYFDEYCDFLSNFKKFNFEQGSSLALGTSSADISTANLDGTIKSKEISIENQKRGFDGDDYNDYELYNRKYELNKLFVKARKSILILQANAFKYMENDLDNFKKSNIYLKLLASENSRLKELSQSTNSGYDRTEPSNGGNRTSKKKGILKGHDRDHSTMSGLGIKYDEINGDPLSNYHNEEDPFLTSSLSNSMGSLKNVNITSPNLSLPGQGNKIFDDNDELVVSYNVINAVEHALNEIIENNNDYKHYDATKLKSDILANSLSGDDFSAENGLDSSAIASTPTSNPNEASNAPLKLFSNYKDLFGQGSSLFKSDFGNDTSTGSDGSSDKDIDVSTKDKNDNKGATNPNDGRNRLFDDADEVYEIDDMDSVISEMINSETIGEYETSAEVRLAAPGDLSLTEEIDKLSNDIENLNNQIQILQPLLRKAELTNNIAELRILRKANVSLQREVQLKELQRQQYIVQENDNSLYGKSRVSIQSYITSSDDDSNGREYTSYIIEVQKISADDDNNKTVLAGWIVARRFSQFYMLNKYLKAIYPRVKLLNFPKKNIFSLNQTQQKILIETRKKMLEGYLKLLLEMPDVCKSRIFRLFLSSQNFTNDIFTKKKLRLQEIQRIDSENASQNNASKGLTGLAATDSSLARSGESTHATNGDIRNDSSMANRYKSIEDVTAKLYNGITNGIEYLNGSLVFANSNAQNAGLTTGLPKLNDDDTDTTIRGAGDFRGKSNTSDFKGSGTNEMELQNELNSYDDDKTTFVKPICDLFLSIFALNKSNSWLRGRAILVVLQQLLGSTIERKIREYLSVVKSENKVIDLLNLFKDAIWPNNIFFLKAREAANNIDLNNIINDASSDIQNEKDTSANTSTESNGDSNTNKMGNNGSASRTHERSDVEKENTKNEARTLLEVLITDISSKIVGLNNSKFAAAEIYNMLQNDILNTHLVYSLLDEILEAIFPEINSAATRTGGSK